MDMPEISATDKATTAVCILAEALTNPAPALPFLSLGDEQMGAIHKLDEFFTCTLPTEKEDSKQVHIICTRSPQRTKTTRTPDLLPPSLRVNSQN